MPGVIFLDLETTGLPRNRNVHWSQLDNWPRIVSIAWIIRDTKGLEAEAYHIIQPDGFEIPSSASAIHSITTEIAKRKGRPWGEVSRLLLESIRAKDVSLLVSHNVDFDLPILLSELHRQGVRHNLENLPKYCTMKGYGSTIGQLYVKLDATYLALTGSKMIGAHNALSDARACLHCYDKLRGTHHDGRTMSISNDDQDLIDRILEWAETKVDFDTSTVESIQSSLETHGSLTDRQRSALENIIRGWRIP